MSVAYANDESLYDYHSMQGAIQYIDEPISALDTSRSSFASAGLFLFSKPIRVIDNTRDFANLAAEWEEDTRNISSATQIVLHPAYQRIIGMGPRVLPLIFARFQNEPQHWFWALRAISGEDPVLQEHVGNVRQMASDWFAWAREYGFVQ
jgi:hypothetical protein